MPYGGGILCTGIFPPGSNDFLFCVLKRDNHPYSLASVTKELRKKRGEANAGGSVPDAIPPGGGSVAGAPSACGVGTAVRMNRRSRGVSAAFRAEDVAVGADRRVADFSRAGHRTGSAGRTGPGHRVFSLSLCREYPAGVCHGARGLPGWGSAAQLYCVAARLPQWESCRRSLSALPGQRLGRQKVCIRNYGATAALRAR